MAFIHLVVYVMYIEFFTRLSAFFELCFEIQSSLPSWTAIWQKILPPI